MSTVTKQSGEVSKANGRIVLLIGLSVTTIVVVLLLPRIPQDPAYHNFADQRSLFGIDNALNVLSNIPFLLAGALGIVNVLRTGLVSQSFLTVREKWPYLIFFFGIAVTCFGSSYYHLSPSNERLLWDRLPMAVAFMSLFAAVIVERINAKAGLALMLPLIALGIGSVIYWDFTEQAGRGDLRPYVVVQFYSMLAITLIILLFRTRYSRGADLFIAVAIYAGAKVFELLDSTLFNLAGISGHSLKHLVAALSGYWIVRMLKKREPLR